MDIFVKTYPKDILATFSVGIVIGLVSMTSLGGLGLSGVNLGLSMPGKVVGLSGLDPVFEQRN